MYNLHISIFILIVYCTFMQQQQIFCNYCQIYYNLFTKKSKLFYINSAAVWLITKNLLYKNFKINLLKI